MGNGKTKYNQIHKNKELIDDKELIKNKELMDQKELIKNKELMDQKELENKKKLENELKLKREEFIKTIKKNGLKFLESFPWTFDIDMIFSNGKNGYYYQSFFQYGDYHILMLIYLYDHILDDVKIYYLENIKITVYKRGQKESTYTFYFSFNMLHTYIKNCHICLYYDKEIDKHLIFLYLPEEKTIGTTKLDFDKYVNVVEKWIKWSIKYKEPNSVEI